MTLGHEPETCAFCAFERDVIVAAFYQGAEWALIRKGLAHDVPSPQEIFKMANAVAKEKIP